MADFRKRGRNVNKWYDLYEDWDLIVSSFALQYKLREDDIAVMEWEEFCTLLTGIMPDTPLGMIVKIRAEEDKDMLASFTSEQMSIRNAWRSRHPITENMTIEEKEESVSILQNILAETFG